MDYMPSFPTKHKQVRGSGGVNVGTIVTGIVVDIHSSTAASEPLRQRASRSMNSLKDSESRISLKARVTLNPKSQILKPKP